MKSRFSYFVSVGALCALSQTAGADAAPTPADDQRLDPIVVVATRSPEPLSRIGNSVTVLDDAAIRASQATMLSDLIAQTPGVGVARNGGTGQTTSVFIRGADSDQTVVLIDGVLVSDPSTTTGAYFLTNLLTADVAKIEILRGAQSTLYGSQAIGGVVNVVTAEPSGPFGGDFAAEGGSHDTGYVAADVGAKDGALLWRLSGNWYGTSGIPAFDERLGGARRCASQIGGGTGQLRYDFTPDISLDVRGYYVRARAAFDGYDTPTFTFGDDNEYGKNEQFVGYAGLTVRSPGGGLTNRVAVQYTNAKTRLYDPNAPANYGSPTIETFYGIGGNVREEYQGTWSIAPRMQAVFGAQHERSTIDTDTPAYDIAPAPLRNFATIDSGYLQVQDLVGAGLTLTAGGRYDDHNVFAGHSTGQLAAAWALNGGATVLRASFGQGFKAPSLYQLYSNYGNRGLRPEQADSWDAGIERRAIGARLTVSATYFHRDSHDLIGFFDCTTPNPLCATEPFGYYANTARATAHGIELQGAFDPSAALTLSGNYTVTDTLDRSPGAATFGNQLARRPRQAANAAATYRWRPRWSTTVAARYAGRSFDDAANRIALGGYVLIDLRLSYALRDHLELYGRVENAGGKHYETVYQYGTLGRVGYAGVRAKF